MQQPRLAVAVSGGRDSTALLHCTLRQARALGIEVMALHVHHGLMPQADDWLDHVRRQARRWGAGFDSRRLSGAPSRGDSVEAWARQRRYRALGEMAQAHSCPLVLLAHHRRDQAETWLLQALRGAGAAGLASMPHEVVRQGVRWARPWLGLDPASIDAYVRRHRLGHVEDPSNANRLYLRSRLRHEVWPPLTAAFPEAESALAAAAQRAQEARSLAEEVALADLVQVQQGDRLDRDGWLSLTPARRRNALRAWLETRTGSPPGHALLDRLLAELASSKLGSWQTPGGVLRLYRGSMQWLPSPVLHDDRPDEATPVVLDLSRAGEVDVPAWGGRWQVREASTGGIASQALQHVLARSRQGGERFRLRPGAPARSLKQQYQAAGIPAWQRQGPLLFSRQDELLFVPGLGPEAAFQARAGMPQLQVQWVPNPGAAGPL